jgi:hypothetical protein
VGGASGIGAEPSGAASTRPQGNGLSADEHANAASSRGVSAQEFEQLRSRVERLERELEALRGEGVSEAAGAASSPQEPTAWEVN